MATADFSALIESIYDAALEVERWPAVLSRIGRWLDGTWMLLGLLQVTGGGEFNVQDDVSDPEQLAAFEERFTAPDANPAVKRFLTAPEATIIRREEELTDAEWRSHPLYREIYKPAGLYHGLGSLVLRTDRHIAPLGINRTRKQGPFTRADVDQVALLLPHLRRSMQVTLKIAGLGLVTSTYEALWDRLPYGVALLDREEKLLWANAAAWSILRAADGLDLYKMRLRAAAHVDHAALVRAIASATRNPVLIGAEPDVLSVLRPSSLRPYSLLIAPVSIAAPQFGRSPSTVVIMTDPEWTSEAKPARLAALFRLTPREAALASLLMDGLDLDAIAKRLELSRNTTRQHLRGLFEKTGVHRQAELVRLLLRSPAGLL